MLLDLRNLLLALFSSLLLIGCGAQANMGAPAAGATGSSLPSQWVVGWGVSPQNALSTATDPGGSEQSYRFIVSPSVGGTEERVHFSNYFGSSPITIGAARIAVAINNGPAIDPSQDAPLTFNGNPSVTLQPNQEIDSDPVNITYSFGQQLAVSMYLQGNFPALTEHDSQFINNYLTPAGAGNTTTDAAGNEFSNVTTEWLVLSRVDVYGPYSGTVAMFGSSSMEGHNSDYGNTNSYPVANVPVPGQDYDRPSDWIARSLNASGYNIGVLNAGLLGNPAGEDATTAAGLSVAGVDRIDHDVLQQPGIKAVVIYIGGIDTRQDCLPATSVETSLTTIISKAHAAGVRIILATLPPSEYCLTSSPIPSASNPYAGDVNSPPENGGSTQRRVLNDWIRTSGSQLPGVVAIADFDKMLADPAHPDFMMPNLNSGDNFHPNGPGYGVQVSAISLSSILGQ
jgi:lysophospholipase L1-like esterase